MTYFRCMTVYHLLWSIPTTSSNTINQEYLSIKNTIHFLNEDFFIFQNMIIRFLDGIFLYFFRNYERGFFFRGKTKVKL